MNALAPEDAELLARFERQGFTRAEWTHAMHLRLGWIHLRRWPFDEAMARVRTGILALNDSNGVANDDHGGYHETVTRAWLELIARADDAATSETFLLVNKHLSGPDVLLEHYSQDVLMSREARRGWAEPDLLPW